MIELQSCTKVFGQHRAVDDITCTIQDGVVTGLLGPNGAGKSTLMRCILGLETLSSGTALINGKRYSDLQNPITQIGAILDASAVHPGRSAYNHLLWMAHAAGLPKARVDEVLEIVGLSSVKKRAVGKFSLGMRQRLGLATALLGDPHTLILDEPINGLDPEGIKWVRTFIRALAAQGKSVLVSSHLMSEMALTADHLIVMGGGKLLADASMTDFINSAKKQVVVRSTHLDALQEAATSEGWAVTALVDDQQRPVLKISEQSSDQVGQLAYSLGIPLAELREETSSLEDAFFHLTNESVQYRSHATLAKEEN